MAQLAGWRKRRRKLECSPIPFTFVSKQPLEFTPGGIGDRFRQPMILQHVRYLQRFDADRLVFTNQLR